MNWSELTKRRAYLFLIITTFFISCESPKNIGLDHTNPNGSIGVFFEDSFDLQSKTVLLDSLQTSNGKVASSLTSLVGQYSDPVFGDIKAKAFMDLIPSFLLDSTKIALSGTNQAFKDLTLSLKFNTAKDVDGNDIFSYYGVDFSSTDVPQTIEVYELKDTLDPSAYYTNTDNVDYDATRMLGSITFNPKEVWDSKSGVIDIAITDASYQNRIFAAAAGRATATEFATQVKGLVIVASATNNNAVIGISRSSSRLKMGYSAEVDGTVNQDLVYPMFLTGQAFNNVTSENRTGSLAALSTSSKEIDGTPILYSQSGTGMVARIDLVNVLKLKEKGNISINKAELVFSPLLETISNKATALPPNLILVQANGNIYNRFSSGNFELLANEEASGADKFGSFLTKYNAVFKQYTHNITRQLQEMLNGTRGTQIFVVPSDLSLNTDIAGVTGGGRVSRVLIDNNATSDRRLKLKVFYTVVKQ